MGIGDRIMKYLAGQAARPSGAVSEVVAAGLNQGNRSMIAAAVRACDLSSGQVAADIGFGGGVGLEFLLDTVGSDGRVYGVDISSAMLKRARRRHRAAIASGRLHLAPGSATKLPLDAATVDAMMTVNTVYFLSALAPMLAEAQRVLRPGGRLVIGTRDAEKMGDLPVTQHGFTLRPAPEISSAMADAGFEVRYDTFGGDDPVGTIFTGIASD